MRRMSTAACPRRKILSASPFISRCSRSLSRGRSSGMRTSSRSLRSGSTRSRVQQPACAGFIFGLSKKVLLANVLGALVEAFKASEGKSVLYFWLYAAAYTFAGLLRFFGLQRYGDRSQADLRLSLCRKFRPPLRGAEHNRVLAQVAHFARHMVSGIICISRWGQPRQPAALAA